MLTYRTSGKNHWCIQYPTASYDGGGTNFGREYVELVSERYGHKGRTLEWCSGPAYIGLELLDWGLTHTLTAMDCYRPVIECLEANVARLNLRDQIRAYCCPMISDLPGYLEFDLVIANPPHFLRHIADPRRYVDRGWRTHKEFFKNIAQHLASDAHILLQENELGSPGREQTWAEAIAEGGLKVTDVFNSKTNYDDLKIYYIELKKL